MVALMVAPVRFWTKYNNINSLTLTAILLSNLEVFLIRFIHLATFWLNMEEKVELSAIK
jgi:hypothetical protein